MTRTWKQYPDTCDAVFPVDGVHSIRCTALIRTIMNPKSRKAGDPMSTAILAYSMTIKTNLYSDLQAFLFRGYDTGSQ